MYERILVPVENSDYDQVILAHVRKLARHCGGASIVLIHVADGWAARNIKELHLRESEEMKSDREYIEREKCDLIAMATHGHRGLADVLRGSVAHELRHISMLPVLMVRGHPPAHPKPAS